MNLKESFRYQNFLESMLREACASLQSSAHALNVTRLHRRSKANPEAEDLTETVKPQQPFAPNDDVIELMRWLVEERERLTTAIGKAKASIPFDLDSALETNKFRQQAEKAIRSMLTYKPYTRTETGRDYKFNVAGDQSPYVYEIEVTATDAFDRAAAKTVMRTLIAEADAVSTQIDEAMINTPVDYAPLFDVNETFDDLMAVFMKHDQ